MPTMHEAQAENLAHKWLSNPHGALALHKTRQSVNELWGADYVAALGQKHHGGDWDFGQIACFGCIHVDLELGRIGLVKVRAAGEPHADSQRAANATLLDDLPEPFTAQLDLTQHAGDSDGVLSWTEPITVDVSTLETRQNAKGSTCSVYAHKTARPGRVPLEVGTTQPSRTLLHIREEGGVARWPYGSDWIWVFVDMDRRGADLLELPTSAALARRSVAHLT